MRVCFGFIRALLLPLLLLPALGCSRGAAGGVAREDAAGQTTAPGKNGGIEWVRYFEVPGVSSRERNPKLMMYFTKRSCSPCEMMEKWTFSDRRVSEALKEFVPVRVRGDIELQITRQFKVRTYPMIIFVRMGTGEIDRKAGFRDADFVLRWIEEVKANHTTMAALREELERDPENLQALLKQARNFLDADEIERALEFAKRAEEISPGDPNVLVVFGLYHLRRGKLEEAEAAASAALQADEENEEARRIKVAVLMKKADTALAEGDSPTLMKLLSSVLRMDPENFEGLMGVGRIQIRLDQTDEALANLRRAAQIRPDSPIPHYALGNLYLKIGDDAMAENKFLRALEMDPRYDPPYFRLIELYEKGGMRAEMMEMYERVLPIEPAGAHNQIAWLMATSEHSEILDPEEAARHANIAVELEPHPWYIDTLAEAYYAGGEYGLAIAIIKEAIAKEPEDPQYYQSQLEKFQKASGQTVGEEKQERE